MSPAAAATGAFVGATKPELELEPQIKLGVGL